MRGVPGDFNFAASAISTIERNFPRALGSSSKRKPGKVLPFYIQNKIALQ